MGEREGDGDGDGVGGCRDAVDLSSDAWLHSFCLSVFLY